MTLYRQIVMVILVVFPLLFAGTLTVAVERTRIFLKEQLQSHAQDTATSLGLSLSPHMQDEDLPTMKSMVDAIFDRGYYREIKVEKTDGTPLIVRDQDVKIEGVPAWFVAHLPLDTPEAKAAVMAGWKLAASVYVSSHPGYAYDQLWQTATRIFYWFAALALLALALAMVALHFLLKPLQAVERQAEALCARKYQFQERLPRTRELRRVVVAMNRMTEKVKAMFAEQASSAERLREQAYRDSLTGLGNRRYFDSQLQARLLGSEEAGNGALLLVQLKDLRALNERLGFEAGDRLVAAAARVIEQAVAGVEGAVIARLTGADFGLLLPSVSSAQADDLAKSLAGALGQMSSQGLSESSNVGHVGVAMYEPGRQPGEVLAEADNALRAAQSAGENAWQRYQAEGAAMPGRREWKARLEEVINAGTVVLEGQQVVDAAETGKVLHREVFVRIPNPEGGLWNAGVFMPTAEQLGLARDIDRIVVRQVLEHLGSRSEAVPVAVNLSPASLRNEEFVSWLLGALERAGALRAGIIFELPEFGAVRDLEAVRNFAARVRDLGHGVALDHFGRSFSSFGYLQSLRPEYVKIDRAYTRLADRDDQFFVESLCSVAHSLDILTIAEGVEDQERWEALKQLHVDGIQGYVAGRPEGL